MIDEYIALVVLLETGAKLKLDQEHLETVVPQEGREVIILTGRHRGQVASLREVHTGSFKASLKLAETGEKLQLPYEQFSKRHVE